ncbi:iron-binding protein [Datura stramonium]|uniref:Iron-binding protein n=1 Tax=Datura stramonium TaxID=4076 RepID=A0ABS8SDX4_DATST|nr:iron-binding protein [Datura stramonium]
MLRRVGNRILGLGRRSPATRGVLPRQYHERVVDHYNNPRNVGSFDKNDPTVGTSLVGAPACGDVMKLQIKVDYKTGKITDACFKTFGCGSAIAFSSLATEWVKGRTMEEVLSIKNMHAKSCGYSCVNATVIY